MHKSHGYEAFWGWGVLFLGALPVAFCPMVLGGNNNKAQHHHINLLFQPTLDPFAYQPQLYVCTVCMYSVAEIKLNMADFRDKVEFRSISMTYPTDAHVACNYLLKGAYRPSSYDWIGLFKVGWSTNKDVLYFHWAPYPKSKQEGEEHTGSVMFQGE